MEMNQFRNFAGNTAGIRFFAAQVLAINVLHPLLYHTLID
jgi:hypothetical protein